MKISDVIKSKRIERQLTQEDLANEFFVSRQLISKWETGKSYPDLEQVVHLSDFFDVSIDELMRGDQEMTHSFDKALKFKKYFWTVLIVLIVLIINFFISTIEIEGSPQNLNISRVTLTRDKTYNGGDPFRDWNTDVSANVSSKNPFMRPIQRSFHFDYVDDDAAHLTPIVRYSFNILNIFVASEPVSVHQSTMIDNNIPNDKIKMTLNSEDIRLSVY